MTSLERELIVSDQTPPVVRLKQDKILAMIQQVSELYAVVTTCKSLKLKHVICLIEAVYLLVNVAHLTSSRLPTLGI